MNPTISPAEEYREDLAREIWSLEILEDLFVPGNKKLYDLLCEEADRVQ